MISDILLVDFLIHKWIIRYIYQSFNRLKQHLANCRFHRII